MKSLTFALTSLWLIIAISGCQDATSSRPATNPAAANNTAQPVSSSRTKDMDQDAAAKREADLSDDPGMTTDHDKTIEQEEPSGDESSQAAPNEGDPEPPPDTRP